MPVTISRGAMQDLLIKFSLANPRYRQALIDDPKGLIERQFGTSLGDFRVTAVLDTADTVHVVVPYVASPGELTDADLKRVAGGTKRRSSATLSEITVTHTVDKATPSL
jgi:hypothetical protein